MTSITHTPLTHVAALATGERSAETTDLGERLLWVIGLALLVALAYALMWRAWRRRGSRQRDLPELPGVPAPCGGPLAELTGRYHGTTTAGDWLDRIVAHGLGTRSLAEVTLDRDGVTVRRPGATDFHIPAAALRGARLDKGIAGKVLTEGGLLVITWEHGGRLLDSGFRADHPAEHAAWVRAVTGLSDGAVPAAATPVSGERPAHSPPSPHDQKGAP
ncbi:PH-like domain-containing protein [Wenjunlia vitaminophila]|uniref:PH-like domain-containing protein n=1 Tax=Wenjunlia vitaminophila TaxID=76728 RepID=UPI00036647EA|nr:hypothetical protein [Wenjunlia vitaminophila]